MKRSLKIGIVQAKIPFSIEEGESNILKFARSAKEANIDVLGLPEDCVCGRFKYLESYSPLDFISKTAKRFNISLFGSNVTFEGENYYSTGFYVDNRGRLLSKVHKIILTKPEKEAGFRSGNKIQIFNTKFGKMAILICKDAFSRYSPVWFHELKKRGVEYVLVPSMSLRVNDSSVNFWVHSMWLIARWFDLHIFAPGTVGKNYTPFPSFGNALIVDRDSGFLKRGSQNEEELLIAEITIRTKEEIEKSYKSKWDPVKTPNIKYSTIRQ